MVKKSIIFILFLFSLVSCEIFFRTPFPEELIFFQDSVLVEGIDSFDSARLYVLNDFVFLYINEIMNPDKLFIFTKDLEQVYLDDSIERCHTFAMKEADGQYFIGNWQYDLSNAASISRIDPPVFNSYQNVFPPNGFGFSNAGYNYYVWWDMMVNDLKYVQYSDVWGYNFFDEIPLDMYANLEALYYDAEPDPKISTSPVVVLFFATAGGGDSRGIDIVTIPAGYFEDPLHVYITGPDYFDDFSVKIRDVEPKEFFYSEDGFIIREEESNYKRFNITGEQVKEYTSGMENYWDAYSVDGKTRYIFSGKYTRLMKTGVWW